jgi:peptidoglycan hydrolase CwlO-like protein
MKKSYSEIDKAVQSLSNAKMELHRADREKQGLESHLSSLRRDQGNELARNTSLQKTLEEIKTEIPECQELIRGANQKKVEMIALRDRAKEDLNSDSKNSFPACFSPARNY